MVPFFPSPVPAIIVRVLFFVPWGAIVIRQRAAVCYLLCNTFDPFSFSRYQCAVAVFCYMLRTIMLGVFVD